jgi:hypothetical protein
LIQVIISLWLLHIKLDDSYVLLIWIPEGTSFIVSPWMARRDGIYWGHEATTVGVPTEWLSYSSRMRTYWTACLLYVRERQAWYFKHFLQQTKQSVAPKIQTKYRGTKRTCIYIPNRIVCFQYIGDVKQIPLLQNFSCLIYPQML